MTEADEAWTLYAPPEAVRARVVNGVPFPGERYKTVCKPDGTCERVPFKDPYDGQPAQAIVVCVDATQNPNWALVCKSLDKIVGDWFWETDNCDVACPK